TRASPGPSRTIPICVIAILPSDVRVGSHFRLRLLIVRKRVRGYPPCDMTTFAVLSGRGKNSDQRPDTCPNSLAMGASTSGRAAYQPAAITATAIMNTVKPVQFAAYS